MNVLHYLNVIIGFSLVMLVLSMVTSITAQMWLSLFKTKAREVGNGLTNLLVDIGLEKADAKLKVNQLLDTGSSLLGEKLGGMLRGFSAVLLMGAPKDIGREEFLLLLLRRAKSDPDLAKKLDFVDEKEAAQKLQELEQRMLAEETAAPTLPAQVWRTKAMQTVIPELASKIFARFDEVMDRVIEEVNVYGKQLGIIITLPLLLYCWPVDSIDLMNRLNSDQALSAEIADLAGADAETMKSLLECRTNHPDDQAACKDQEAKAGETLEKLNHKLGLFGGTVGEGSFIERLKNMKPGIFVTWILVSLGSAFWLGVLNKMLGIRSELTNKLNVQREYRATSQPTNPQ